MKKPKIVLLSYLEHIRDLEEYVDLEYHNCNMPEEHFFKVAKDADLIIEQEFNDGKAKYAGILQMINKPKAVWLIDTHTRPDHSEYAKNFDHVFVAIDHMRNKFDMETKHLPLACTFSKNQIKQCTIPKEYDVAFVGQFLVKGGRRDILNRLSKDLNMKNIHHVFTTAYGQEYINIHQKAHAAFNKSIGDELNFRIFEVMAMGVPQVTDWNNECAKIKELKERVFGYSDYNEIIPHIENILSKGIKWARDFTLDNQEWIKSKHMITHRHLDIIEHCLGYSVRK